MEDIVHEIEVPASVQDAYAATATQAGIRGWWSSRATVAEQVGGDVELRFPFEGNDAIMNFRVEVLDAPKSVRWLCTANVNPVWINGTIEWTVEPNGAGSKVTLAHRGFSAGGPPYDMTVEGWKPFVASLVQYLSGGEAQPAG